MVDIGRSAVFPIVEKHVRARLAPIHPIHPVHRLVIDRVERRNSSPVDDGIDERVQIPSVELYPASHCSDKENFSILTDKQLQSSSLI